MRSNWFPGHRRRGRWLGGVKDGRRPRWTSKALAAGVDSKWAGLPDVGVFTNLTRDHLDNPPARRKPYLAGEAKLLSRLARWAETAVASTAMILRAALLAELVPNEVAVIGLADDRSCALVRRKRV